MKVLKNHYDKLLLVLNTLVLIFLSSYYIFESSDSSHNTKFTPQPHFAIDKLFDEEIVKLPKTTHLLPSQVLNFISTDNDVKSFTIQKVIFKRKAKVSIHLKNSSTLVGRLLNSNATVLSENWRLSKMPISIDTDSGIKNVSSKDITFIKGDQSIVLNNPLGDIDPDNWWISTYQNKSAFFNDLNQTDRVRWVNSSSDSNSTIYDLFTPPIIYLVDGILSTTLPIIETKNEQEEPFGISLVKFEKKKYRFRISSWIGQTPYFDDLHTKFSSNSDRYVKNRIELKVPYKLNLSYQPGSPTLLKTTLDDEDKLLMVEYFSVQQIKDPKTGGSRSVGRALVRDYRLGGKPFEINSLMKDVYSGETTIVLKVELPGLDIEEILLSETDLGKKISLGGRTYEVLNVDSSKKKVTLKKSGPNPTLAQEKTLQLL